MKYLIVGLGNIGLEYETTRHNIGFDVIDALVAGKEDFKFETGRKAMFGEFRHKGRTLILLKPTTYMNLSGEAVQYWLQHEKIQLQNLLVITDDLALPFGSLRLRPKGSSAGHNGLRDIQHILNTDVYPKLRFGIGNNFPKGMQSDFVLGKWENEEIPVVKYKIEQCVSIIEDFSVLGLDRTMTVVNNRVYVPE